MKSVLRYAAFAVIPLLAACGNDPKTAQVPIPTQPISSSAHASKSDKGSTPTAASTHGVKVPAPAPVITAAANPGSVSTATSTAAPTPLSAPHRQDPKLAASHSASTAPQRGSQSATTKKSSRSSVKPAETEEAVNRSAQAPPVIALSTARTSPSAAIKPVTKKAPVLAASSATGKPVVTRDSDVFTGQIIPLPVKGPEGKWATSAKVGDGTWFVWLNKITDTTLTFKVLSNSGCGDPQTCTTTLGIQTLPFASHNTPTTVYLGSYPEATTGVLTAPVWAFAKMYNSGGDGLHVDLRTINFGSTYAVPAAAKAIVTLPNSRVD